jgi:hypothetical protein
VLRLASHCCQFTPRSVLLSYPVPRGLHCYNLLGSAWYLLPKVCGNTIPFLEAEGRDAFPRTVSSE